MFKCSIADFSIDEAFEISDLLYENDYVAVSCAMYKDERWAVEILDDKPIDELRIRETLKKRKFEVIENARLADVNWLQKCFENFKPLVIGSFYIYGPHLKSAIRPENKIDMEIAAATAFGTGEHATTSRCLVACEAYFDKNKHKRVLDIGCGSGILSIAIAKMGGDNIVACDIDPESVRVAKHNAEINKVAHRMHIFQNNACEFNIGNYDMIVANILAEPLVSMSEEIIKCLNKDGILILSGFTHDDLSVEKKFVSLGLTLKHKYNHKGWSTLVLQSA